MDLESGCIVGLVAPNGTGKTTLMRGINNDIALKSGQIVLSNNETIFFLENQDALFPMLTVKEMFEYVSKSWKSEVISDEVIDLLKISNYVDKRISSLSLGMRQMVMIGVYLIVDSDIMLFDEPINGLDQVNMSIISNVMLQLKKQKKIVIVSSHLLDNLSQFVDEFWYLKQGKIIKNLKNTNNILKVKHDYENIYGDLNENTNNI
ncbi:MULTISPECIES: ATP-binding cassette domain-containing protein [Leuconostoc]|uniref:ATP-binding cassette domain-containing protein n=1 Tax=Leuconostoc TaxID=1243 RepID=UPI0024A83441|nr:ATP-binding cassette domain-containing protein [Leuconostoc falkenbergense]MDI6553304.1 ATP-binding cassette domain-containing protein [Leuconostoc falkenbergense]